MRDQAARGPFMGMIAIFLLLSGCAGGYRLDPSEARRIGTATYVVTGASSGFGMGVALALAERGANVVLAARRSHTLEHVAARVRRLGGTPLVVATDVADPAVVARLMERAIARFGTLDVWINNAGVTAIGAFEEIPLADHGRLIDVNLKGVIHGSHAAMRRFRKQGHGTLVNIGSVVAEVPLAYQASYSASKAGVLALGRALIEEIRLSGARDIHVATVLPWAADTPIWRHAANYTDRSPCLPAMDDARDVVAAIVWLSVNPREELSVGWKARGTSMLHGLFPDLTERVAGDVAHRYFLDSGVPVGKTSGNLHEPMGDEAAVTDALCR